MRTFSSLIAAVAAGSILLGQPPASAAPAALPSAPGDQPQLADFDGDGTTDPAVFRPSTGQWFVHGGTPQVVSHGLPGDTALVLPHAIRPRNRRRGRSVTGGVTRSGG